MYEYDVSSYVLNRQYMEVQFIVLLIFLYIDKWHKSTF